MTCLILFLSLLLSAISNICAEAESGGQYVPGCSFEEILDYSKDEEGYIRSDVVCQTKNDVLSEIQKFVYYRVPLFTVMVEGDGELLGKGNDLIEEAVKEHKITNGFMSYHAWNMVRGYGYWWHDDGSEQKNLLFCVCSYYSTFDDEKLVYAEAGSLIQSLLDSSMSDYEKAYVLCSWVDENVVYGRCEDDRCHDHAAYGALIERKATCLGIASAVKLLLDKADVPCQIVSGEHHAWNIAKIDGKWYYIDLTGGWMFLAGSKSFTEARHPVVEQHIAAFMPLIERDDYTG